MHCRKTDSRGSGAGGTSSRSHRDGRRRRWPSAFLPRGVHAPRGLSRKGIPGMWPGNWRGGIFQEGRWRKVGGAKVAVAGNAEWCRGRGDSAGRSTPRAEIGPRLEARRLFPSGGKRVVPALGLGGPRGPPPLATRHSPLATRHSPLAARRREILPGLPPPPAT
jgi:hypothetical protein